MAYVTDAYIHHSTSMSKTMTCFVFHLNYCRMMNCSVVVDPIMNWFFFRFKLTWNRYLWIRMHTIEILFAGITEKSWLDYLTDHEYKEENFLSITYLLAIFKNLCLGVLKRYITMKHGPCYSVIQGKKKCCQVKYNLLFLLTLEIELLFGETICKWKY